MTHSCSSSLSLSLPSQIFVSILPSSPPILTCNTITTSTIHARWSERYLERKGKVKKCIGKEHTWFFVEGTKGQCNRISKKTSREKGILFQDSILFIPSESSSPGKTFPLSDHPLTFLSSFFLFNVYHSSPSNLIINMYTSFVTWFEENRAESERPERENERIKRQESEYIREQMKRKRKKGKGHMKWERKTESSKKSLVSYIGIPVSMESCSFPFPSSFSFLLLFFFLTGIGMSFESKMSSGCKR